MVNKVNTNKRILPYLIAGTVGLLLGLALDAFALNFQAKAGVGMFSVITSVVLMILIAISWELVLE